MNLKQAFEEWDKNPRQMPDEEISSQLEALESRVATLQAEQTRRVVTQNAMAENELASQVITQLEAKRAAFREMAEQSGAIRQAEQLAQRTAQTVVVPKTKEERLADLEKITGPLPKI